MAWAASYPEAATRTVTELEQLLPQYEQALEEINQAYAQGQLTQADLAYAQQIEAEYAQLFAEHKRLTTGNS
jgi:hypothetical protein